MSERHLPAVERRRRRRWRGAASSTAGCCRRADRHRGAAGKHGPAQLANATPRRRATWPPRRSSVASSARRLLLDALEGGRDPQRPSSCLFCRTRTSRSSTPWSAGASPRPRPPGRAARRARQAPEDARATSRRTQTALRALSRLTFLRPSLGRPASWASVELIAPPVRSSSRARARASARGRPAARTRSAASCCSRLHWWDDNKLRLDALADGGVA